MKGIEVNPNQGHTSWFTRRDRVLVGSDSVDQGPAARGRETWLLW